MKKKNPVVSAGYFASNPTGAIFASLNTIKKIGSETKKGQERISLGSDPGRATGRNEGNGPHPAVSPPSAGDDEAARQGRRISRFVAGKFAAGSDELSRRIAGRSCLPHTRFPPDPSPTEMSFDAEKQEELSLSGVRRRRTPAEMAVAPDSTRDSILFFQRERGRCDFVRLR